ncbi:MAG: UDP-3-O-acyl-N-acetylglucosamine deacetylase [Candidatus Margulisiibacteriota bacterium]
MFFSQKTISRSVSVSGKGIHSGKSISISLNPGLPNSGISFRFTDEYSVRLSPEHVLGKSRGTNLCWDMYELKTIEHFLASLSGLGISNIEVQFNDNNPEEMPILDGGAKEWCNLLLSASICDQQIEWKPLIIKNEIVVRHDDKYIIATPADHLKITCKTDFPILGSQEASFVLENTNFHEEIAPARTFGFEWELEALAAQGLAKGASLNNALLIKQDGFSSPLNFPNEPARHKLLDLIGDLYTLGRPILANIEAYKPGHIINIEFAKKLYKLTEAPNT